ncbi:MAG: glycosyltransferase [Clostridia bacterium]|nr:glycosyltransferase [Clostridia bacterium]
MYWAVDIEWHSGYRDSKNPTDTWISNTHSLYYWLQNFFFNKARMNLGKSCFLNGTGMMISREFIEQNGYNVKTITEDIELTVQCAINKERIAFAEEAITYDEQPLRFGESYKQRKRWSKGMLDCLKIYKKDLKSGIFRRFELLDASILILSPIMQIVGTLFYITYIILGICEKININYSSKLVFILVSYLMMIMVSSAVTKLANKKVKENLKGIIFLPLFIFSWIPINFEAVMKKQLNWESIEHSRIISIETAMEKRELRTLRKTTNKGLLKIS